MHSAAARAELPRVVVVLEESVDGKKAGTSAAEIALTSALSKEGYRLIAGDVADKLRKAQAVSLTLSGGIPDVLSSLDADVVILGQVEMAKIGVIEGAGLVGYHASATAKLVRVDSAQIVQAFSLEGKGNDFSDAGAAQKAARSVGEILAREVKAAIAELAKKPKSIDLVVHGVPDRAQGDALKSALGKVRGVSGVVVRQSGTGITKIEVTSATDADTLATDVEKAALPLDIVQTSSSSILARYDMKRGVKLGALILPSKVKLGARGEWVAHVLPELVRAETQNVMFLDVVEKNPEVALLPEAKSAGKNISLTITVQDPTGKKSLFVASGTGSLDELPALVSSVMKKIDEGFLPALARSQPRNNGTALARAALAGKDKPEKIAAVDTPEIRIAGLKLDNLFPAKLGYYQENAVGSVILEHSDKDGAAANDVVVSVYIPRFMQLKSDIVVGKLAPGERREIPLKITLDAGTLFAAEENTPTQAEVVVDYNVSGGKMNARRVAPLLVYGRRTIDWTENNPIAAFVTPQEEVVRTFARSALIDGDKSDRALPEAVANAVALFEGMRALDLRYVKDPVMPARSGSLDAVQFARETLEGKSGDCDDLSVLYASLLESVGVETAFFLVPGHVFVGVSTGAPADALDRVTFDPARVVVSGGKAWIPVETTALQKSFRDAWNQGAVNVQRVAKKRGAEGLQIVETRRAWAAYPPAPLPRTAGVQVAVAHGKKSNALEETQLVVAEREAARQTRLDVLAKAVAKDPSAPEASAYAALLARGGDVEKARSVLQAAVGKTQGETARVTLVNNLANVDVLSGAPAAAVASYRSILDAAGERKGDVLTNLGIAYTAAGDPVHAVDAFEAALKEGATTAFVATGIEEKTRAGNEARLTVAEQDLKAVLAKAIEQRKKNAAAKDKTAATKGDRFANPMPSGARRGDDPQSKLRTAELLRWMS